MKRFILLMLFVAGVAMTYAQSNGQWRPKGYRGFFENRCGVNPDNEDLVTYSLATVHGYQFNSHLFAGAGLSLDFEEYNGYSEYDKTTIPMFADVRYTILKTRVSPYLEARLGYSAGDYQGVYEGFMVGCDVAIKPKFALYAAIGVTVQEYELINSESDYRNNLTFTIGLHF